MAALTFVSITKELGVFLSVCLSAAHILGTEMSGGTVIMNTGRSVPILIKTDPRDLMICDLNNFWNVTAKVVIMLHHGV